MEANFTIWCEVESNIPSTITVFHKSHNSSDILAVGRAPEIKHFITSASCLSEMRLKCLAENDVGQTERSMSPEITCKLFMLGSCRSFRKSPKTYLFNLAYPP